MRSGNDPAVPARIGFAARSPDLPMPPSNVVPTALTEGVACSEMERASNGRRMNGRIKELDGLRGFSCLIVVVAHYFGETRHGIRLLAQGWAGVELFFCLSGFLIGGILIDNLGSPSYFQTFYMRRMCRIFPIYYLTVSLVLIASAVLPFAAPARSPAIYFTYTLNFVLAATGVEGTYWLLPTWTLCVEEQFYLLFPLFLYAIPRRWRLERVLLGMIALSAIVRGGLIVWGANDLAVRTLLPGRMDALFLGVLGAYALRTPKYWNWLTRDNRFNLKLITLTAVAGLPVLALCESLTGFDFFDLLGWTNSAICFTGLILLIVDGSPEGRRFRYPFFCFLGTISYCLYLIHQPISGILHGLILGSKPDSGTPAQLAVSFLSFGVSIGVATLSWRYFEKPFLGLGQRWRYA